MSIRYKFWDLGRHTLRPSLIFPFASSNLVQCPIQKHSFFAIKFGFSKLDINEFFPFWDFSNPRVKISHAFLIFSHSTLRHSFGFIRTKRLTFLTEKYIFRNTANKFYLGHPVTQNCPYFRGWVFRTNSPSVLVLKVDVDDKYDDITYLRNASSPIVL